MQHIQPLGMSGSRVVVLSYWNGRVEGILSTDGVDWYVGDYLWSNTPEEPMYLLQDD